MTKICAVIRHVYYGGIGSLEAVIQDNGYEIQYFEAPTDDFSAARDADLTVICGGPVGVYQAEDYPFLKQEIEIAKHRIDHHKPTLGLCLGGQVIACAAGGRVYPGENGQEIGWHPITLTEAGRESVIAPLVDGQGAMLHWHGDTFDLPDGAVLLASSAQYKNQAFSLGENILAFQCHPEVFAHDMEHWFLSNIYKISHLPEIDVQTLRADTMRYGADLERRARAMLAGWLDQLTS